MKHDILADIFSVIKNAESIGKPECIVPASKLVDNVLKIMKQHNYIGKYEFIDDGKSGRYKIVLLGRINDCNVIKPRFSVSKEEFIKYEKRFLPARGVGIIILTTSKGVMDHEQAKKQNVGGNLLGFVY